MSTTRIGYFLTALGVIGVVLSVIMDFVGIGDEGIGAAQLSGILLGIIITTFGVALVRTFPDAQLDLKGTPRIIFERLLDLPASVWVATGFLIVYVLFFLSPVFLNDERSILYFNRFLPDRNPIGVDLNLTSGHVYSWLTTGQSPYPDQLYPPLTYILLAPLTLFNYPASYFVATYLTLVCYIILAGIIPAQFSSDRDYSLILLFAVTGLFSYGFQFELERGQYYTVTFLLCMLSIYIFHKHHDFRLLGYLLYSFSIHLKIFPLFFLPMFIKDWRDWKGNVRRMLGLGLFNFLLLFVLGYHNFLGFIQAILVPVQNAVYNWNFNHSLSSFMDNLLKDGYNLFSPAALLVLQQNANVLEKMILVIVVVCVLSMVIHAYWNRQVGFDPYLLLACTIVALIIPVSVDYSLPVMVAPMAIFFANRTLMEGSVKKRIITAILVLVISIAYATILFPFKYKPYYLNNAFPPLFIVLISVTWLNFLKKENLK